MFHLRAAEYCIIIATITDRIDFNRHDDLFDDFCFAAFGFRRLRCPRVSCRRRPVSGRRNGLRGSSVTGSSVLRRSSVTGKRHERRDGPRRRRKRYRRRCCRPANGPRRRKIVLRQITEYLQMLGQRDPGMRKTSMLLQKTRRLIADHCNSVISSCRSSFEFCGQD